MFAGWGSWVARFRWPVLSIALVAVISAGVWGLGVFGQLTEGGYNDPDSESSQAAEAVEKAFGAQGGDLVVVYTPAKVKIDDAELGKRIRTRLALLPKSAVTGTSSYWQTRSAQYAAKDKTSGVAVISLAGADDGAKLDAFRDIKDKLAVEGTKAQFSGGVVLSDATSTRSTDDLARAELISLPVVLVLLLFLFGSLVAASLPVLVGGAAVLGSLGVLHAVAAVHDVNSFAVNVASLLGLGMAIDYGLFMVGRFREEQASGRTPQEAVRRTVATAGRTVAFSATLLMIALGGLLLFPQGFLKSLAYGGLAAVGLAALLSLTLLPAMLAVLGPRVDKLPIRLPGRNRPGTFWARLATAVLRRPVVVVLPILAGLLVLAAPIAGVRFGEADERTLPAADPARQAIETLKADYPQFTGAGLPIVLRGDADTSAFAVTLRQIKGIAQLGPAQKAGDITVFNATLASTDPFSVEAREVVGQIRSLAVPHGAELLVGGTTARNVDSLSATAARLPLMVGLLVGATLILMFLAFGSILLPIKAVVMSALSLSATFGVLVWIFQDGHGAGLLSVTPAPLEAGIVVLMAAVVFGLSTDYEVFLLSRMVEARANGAGTNEAVTVGLARTGRVISAAALLLIVVTGAFALSSVTTMRFVGVGMIVALFLDATVVRMLLVPAVLGLLGNAAWWAPGPLRRLQERAGLAEHAGEQALALPSGKHSPGGPDGALALPPGPSAAQATDENKPGVWDREAAGILVLPPAMVPAALPPGSNAATEVFPKIVDEEAGGAPASAAASAPAVADDEVIDAELVEKPAASSGDVASAGDVASVEDDHVDAEIVEDEPVGASAVAGDEAVAAPAVAADEPADGAGAGDVIVAEAGGVEPAAEPRGAGPAAEPDEADSAAEPGDADSAEAVVVEPAGTEAAAGPVVADAAAGPIVVDAPAEPVVAEVEDAEPVVGDVVADEPAAAQPAAAAAAAEPVVAEEPDVSDKPALADEPVAVDEPAVAEPSVVDEPIAVERSVGDEPDAVEASVADEPVAAEPVVVDEPVATEPVVVDEPVATEPVVVDKPVAAERSLGDEPVAAEPPVGDKPVAADVPGDDELEPPATFSAAMSNLPDPFLPAPGVYRSESAGAYTTDWSAPDEFFFAPSAAGTFGSSVRPPAEPDPAEPPVPYFGDRPDFERTRNLAVPDLDVTRSFDAPDLDATTTFRAPDFDTPPDVDTPPIFEAPNRRVARGFESPDPATSGSIVTPDLAPLPAGEPTPDVVPLPTGEPTPDLVPQPAGGPTPDLAASHRPATPDAPDADPPFATPAAPHRIATPDAPDADPSFAAPASAAPEPSGEEPGLDVTRSFDAPDLDATRRLHIPGLEATRRLPAPAIERALRREAPDPAAGPASETPSTPTATSPPAPSSPKTPASSATPAAPDKRRVPGASRTQSSRKAPPTPAGPPIIPGAGSLPERTVQPSTPPPAASEPAAAPIAEPLPKRQPAPPPAPLAAPAAKSAPKRPAVPSEPPLTGGGRRSTLGSLFPARRATGPGEIPAPRRPESADTPPPFGDSTPARPPLDQPAAARRASDQPAAAQQPFTPPAPTRRPANEPAPTQQPFTPPAPTRRPSDQPAPTQQPFTPPVPARRPSDQAIPVRRPFAEPAPAKQPTDQPAPGQEHAPLDEPAWTRQRDTLDEPTPLRRPATLGDRPYSFRPTRDSAEPPAAPTVPAATPAQPAATSAAHPAAAVPPAAPPAVPAPRRPADLSDHLRESRPADLSDHLRESRPADLAQYSRTRRPTSERPRGTAAEERPAGQPSSARRPESLAEHKPGWRPASLADESPQPRRGSGDDDPAGDHR